MCMKIRPLLLQTHMECMLRYSPTALDEEGDVSPPQAPSTLVMSATIRQSLKEDFVAIVEVPFHLHFRQ